MAKVEKKLENLQEQVNENTLRLERITSKDWYSNKQLFEMMQDMSKRLDTFNEKFDRYNGLIEKQEKNKETIQELHDRVSDIESESEGFAKAFELIRKWGGWIVAILALAAKMGWI